MEIITPISCPSISRWRAVSGNSSVGPPWSSPRLTLGSPILPSVSATPPTPKKPRASAMKWAEWSLAANAEDCARENLPTNVRQHLIDRMRDRAISLADLNQLRLWIDLWIESQPEVPEGD